MNFNSNEYFHLKRKETGEALDIKRTYKWILNSMPYDDFVKLMKLSFINKTPREYKFTYHYEMSPKNDTPAAREKYIKYLCFKLYQNLCTGGVELV